MKCPACQRDLFSMKTGSITVDVCNKGCGGIWFDRFELSKVDEPFEFDGEVLLSIEKDDRVVIDPHARRKCIRDGAVMMRHFFSVKRQVLVDECPKCASMWLDAGELALIRKQFRTEDERKKAAEAYFGEVFGEQLNAIREKNKDGASVASKIMMLFRSICPPQYFPKK